MSMQGGMQGMPAQSNINREHDEWDELRAVQPVDETAIQSLIFMQHGALESLNKTFSVLSDKLQVVLIPIEDMPNAVPHDTQRNPIFRSELGRMAVQTYEHISMIERRVYELIQRVNV
jgi:hypothetical protein